MPVDFVCQCGERVSIPDNRLGKWIKCRKCKREFQAPRVKASERRAALPVVPSRYAAVADRRPSPVGGPLMLFGAIFGAVAIIAIVAIVLQSQPDEAPAKASAPVASKPASSPSPTEASGGPTDSAVAPGSGGDVAEQTENRAAPGSEEKATADAATAQATAPAPTTKPAAAAGAGGPGRTATSPATKVEDTAVEPGPLHAGPFDIEVTAIEVVDGFTCSAPLVVQIAGKPLELKPSREGFKLAVVSMHVTPTRVYSEGERAAVSAAPILAEGKRKLGEEEQAMTTRHLHVASLPSGADKRVAMPAMLLFPDRSAAGYILGGSGDSSYFNAAVMLNGPLDMVAVFEVEPTDANLILIAAPVPLEALPAMRVTVTNAGLLGPTGTAPLTKLDAGLVGAVR